MNTTKSKDKFNKFNGYKSFGDMFVGEAKKQIEEDKKRGYMRFCESSITKKTLKMDF